MSIVAVIPSRGRPSRAYEAVEALRATAHLVTTTVVLAVDADDPELEAYRALRWDPVPYRAEVTTLVLEEHETGNLVKATNTVSTRIAAADPDAVIGNLGDDHIARTPGWDRRIAEVLATPGIAYGDDLLQGENIPTAPFISASIVSALGWYALPRCRHLYIDDAWRELGRAAGCLRYVPDVVFEHMHPGAGKAELDDGYRRVYTEETKDHDKAVFMSWNRSRRFRRDVETVQAVIGQPSTSR